MVRAICHQQHSFFSTVITICSAFSLKPGSWPETKATPKIMALILSYWPSTSDADFVNTEEEVEPFH